MSKIARLILMAALLVALVSCGDGGARSSAEPSNDGSDDDVGGIDDDRDWDDPMPRAVGRWTDEGSDEPFRAGYEYILVPGTDPGVNPATGATTPSRLDVIPLFRFRLAADIEAGRRPRPVNAIVILQPGFTAGASQLFTMARWLVQMSEGRFEVWVPDRRWTLLEDQTGMDAAEAARDPWIAYNYYFKGLRIGAKKYHAIHPRGPQTDMMSEWGLDMWLADLRRLVELVPKNRRATNVIMAGDSRGAVFTQAFAAHEFKDGRMGTRDLAGIALWDGGVRSRAGFTETDYLRELDNIRSGRSWRTESVTLAARPLIFLEILGMMTQPDMVNSNDPRLGPDGFFPDFRLLELLYPLLTRFRHITMTNEAKLGIAIDSDSMPWRAFLAHAGRIGGGPVTDGVLGEYPTDPGSIYYWRQWDEVEPRELVDLRKIGRMFYEGPSNFTDHYYPSRISLDMDVADRLETEGTWRHDYFPMYSSRIDVPVFALSSDMWDDSTQVDELRDLLPPVRGETRGRDEIGFDHHVMPEWSHLDALMVEPEVNPVLPALIDWIDEWTTGEVRVPRF